MGGGGGCGVDIMELSGHGKMMQYCGNYKK